ncbi:FAD-binding protein [Candidatus Sumerlaeota bacterium]|nr:FAD-binding protein [Candidatus Sumerlaeota bacterium]
MLDSGDISDLISLVGKDRVFSAPEDLVAYSYDASRAQNLPDIVTTPGSSEDVQKILRFASERRIPVYPRGSGTGMTGGSVPEQGGIALVMTSMNRILDIDSRNLTARVQPGLILHEFKETVKKQGLFYPPDPASAKFASIGGTVAVNAGGLNSVKYGVTRDYVLSLEAVTPIGDILRFGASTMKSVTGYDMTRLLVGSEGTLAIITEITVKLIPHPRSRFTILASFTDDQDALNTAQQIMEKGLIPCALEFMDETAVHCARIYSGHPFLNHAAGVLLIEFDSLQENGMDLRQDISRAKEVLASCGALETRETADPKEREELWEIRKCLSPAVYEIAPSKLNEDICIPRSEMISVIQEIKTIARNHGINVVNFAHAGDGNIHVNFMYDGKNPEQADHAHRAVEELFRMTVKRRGTLSGEHGIGRTKLPFLSLEYGEGERKIMREIKKLFDPEGILNPNKSIM